MKFKSQYSNPFRFLAGFFLCTAIFVTIAATSGNIQWTQIRSSDRHGTDAKGQSSDGTGTSGHVASYDSNGGLTDGGAPSGGSVTNIATTSPITGGPITATGTIACATCTVTLCSGTITPTGTLMTASQSSVGTATCSGLASTDNILCTFNANPFGVTGFVPATTGILTVACVPSTNTVTAYASNNTGGSLTLGSIVINYRVVR